jgi:hypothetical protein
MNLIALEVGDTGDGHEKSDFINFDVTGVSRSELLRYYKKGCEILGMDLENQCSDYEERTLSQAFNDALIKCDISTPDENFDIDFNTEDFAELYMRIAKLAEPELKWVRVTIDSLHIGGYGFFS